MPKRGLQGLHQLLRLDSYRLLEIGFHHLLETGLIQVQKRGLCRLQQKLCLPKVLLAPLGSAHMSSGSSRQQEILC